MPDHRTLTPTDRRRYPDASGYGRTGAVRELLGAMHDAPQQALTGATRIDAC